MNTKPSKQSNKRGKSYKDEVGIKLFGDRIKAVRTEKGITQEQLQHLTGFELRQIGRIERGEVNTSISHAFKIAEALQVAVSELFAFPSKNISKKK